MVSMLRIYECQTAVNACFDYYSCFQRILLNPPFFLKTNELAANAIK